jgi:hypothetical protein
MKSIRECQEIKQEYLLFLLAPQQHADRIIELANEWIAGFEEIFEKYVGRLDPDYWEDMNSDPYVLFWEEMNDDGSITISNDNRYNMCCYEDMIRLRNRLVEKQLENFSNCTVGEIK